MHRVRQTNIAKIGYSILTFCQSVFDLYNSEHREKWLERFKALNKASSNKYDDIDNNLNSQTKNQPKCVKSKSKENR